MASWLAARMVGLEVAQGGEFTVAAKNRGRNMPAATVTGPMATTAA
ncbi:hypothetical protein [Streptomyces sp. RP5T]|nr:hypothetical protein [Streptomyces sp. RP5T]